MDMNEQLRQVLNNFELDAVPVCCHRYGHGHINETYLVTTRFGSHYILQKINNKVFKNIHGLMGNIEAVTAFLRQQTNDARRVLQLVKTTDKKSYLRCPDESYWRVYVFVEDALCLQQPQSPADFYESAIAFGQFQQMLGKFPADTLYETIPNFHNTRDRYRIFRETLQKDPANRAKNALPEIEFALAREKEAAVLVEMLEDGALPLRVTHNDTKLNNVMLDAQTRKALCVIDLDTVMPGSSLYDFGDSIRFGASSGDEDERDLDKIEMSLALFKTYTEGFLTACPGLTQTEIRMLPMGAKLMTLECGVRFLTDYLDGDHYFSTSREGQNLDRCRTQFKLVADMECKWEQMQMIVRETGDLRNNTGV